MLSIKTKASLSDGSLTPFLFYFCKRRRINMDTVSDYFGCMVFDDREMKANLSADIYQSLRDRKSVV